MNTGQKKFRQHARRAAARTTSTQIEEHCLQARSASSPAEVPLGDSPPALPTPAGPARPIRTDPGCARGVGGSGPGGRSSRVHIFAEGAMSTNNLPLDDQVAHLQPGAVPARVAVGARVLLRGPLHALQAGHRDRAICLHREIKDVLAHQEGRPHCPVRQISETDSFFHLTLCQSHN